MSHEAYEDFILEWGHGYLSKPDLSGYSSVYRCGGSGDMGRDVVAKVNNSDWDNYQCKHYNHALHPSDIWKELGKLCYYTYNNSYTIPRYYYFVAPDGAGGSLMDYINKPSTINDELINQWETYCEAKITSKAKIVLENGLLDYVKGFDFSIVKISAPLDVIEQHSQTIWHQYRFGLYKKNRPPVLNPDPVITNSEIIYVQEIFNAYSEYANKRIAIISDFDNDTYLKDHFNRQRISFYSAESLKQFARDLNPGLDWFNDLKTEMLSGVIETCYDQHDTGLKRLSATLDKAVSISVNDNILGAELKNDDRKGLCHHLANEGELKWMLHK